MNSSIVPNATADVAAASGSSTLEPEVNSDVTHVSTPRFTGEELVLWQLFLSVNWTLSVYVNVAMAAFGLAANAVAVVVLLPRALKSSTFNYLLGLAVSDTLYLTWYALFWLLATRYDVDLRRKTNCSLHYLIFAASELSAMFLLLCCVERALIVYFPTKAKQWFSPLRARLAMLVVLILVLGFNWYVFFIRTDFDSPEWNICEGMTAAIEFYKARVFYWVDSALYSFIPTLGLIIANGAIVIKFAASRNAGSDVAQKTMSKNSRQVTVMAVTLAVLYLVTTVPLVLVSILRGMYGDSDVALALRLLIAIQLLNSVSYINHSCNMLLYLSFSEEIRKDVIAMLKCARIRRLITSSVHPSTSSQNTGTTLVRLDHTGSAAQPGERSHSEQGRDQDN